MPTRVKICGITRAQDALLAVELGAAALGFNFYPRSPRYIRPSAAAGIIRQLPPFVIPVGIFADESEAERVINTARDAGVRAIQLHGPRFPTFESLQREFQIIRAVAVDEKFKPELLRGLGEFYAAFLLDGFDPNLLGGTGKKFDWNLAIEAKRFGPVILAGGLTAENVGEAIRRVKPYAVDVASGVESVPGLKDPAKLRAFFTAVAAADRGD